MRLNGVRAVTATCEACNHQADVNVDALLGPLRSPKPASVSAAAGASASQPSPLGTRARQTFGRLRHEEPLRKSDFDPPLIHVSVTDGLLRAVRLLHPLRRPLRRQPRHRVHGARRCRVGRLRGPIGPHPAQDGRRLRSLRDPKRASQRHNISRLQGVRHLHAVVQALESRATHDLLDTLRPALAAPSPPAEAPNLHSVRPSLCGGASRRQVLLQSMPSEGAPAQPPSYPASCRGAPSVRDHAHTLRTSSSTLSSANLAAGVAATAPPSSWKGTAMRSFPSCGTCSRIARRASMTGAACATALIAARARPEP